MLQLLSALRHKVAIGFVGGSDLAKQQEQLGTPSIPVTNLFDFCFAENGLTAIRMGVPLASLVMALLTVALWRAWRRAWAVQADGAFAHAAFVMVLMMALHSQLEYPLWYAYFLLPTAWVWGVCLGGMGRALTPALSRWRERGQSRAPRTQTPPAACCRGTGCGSVPSP